MGHTRERIAQSIRDQRGVTGLETAIILIAFVVVASVFAFTVLSTGIFSAEKGKETIHAGLKEARSSVELKGSVIANGVGDITISTADSAWTKATSTQAVTSTADTIDKKKGTASADVAVSAAFTTGLAAYADLSGTVDISDLDTLEVWVQSDLDTALGDLQIVLDDTAGCGSTLEDIDLPALSTSTWKRVVVAIDNNDDMTAIKCVGLSIATDQGAQTINVDNVVSRGQATSLVMTLTNALGGEPVDVSEPSDADGDGLADSDSRHTLVLTYNDDDQIAKDIYWTQAFIGDNDSDNLLESGEKAELTIKFNGLASTTPVVKDVTFSVELRPEDGGVMVIERTMPDRIDTVMNLN